MKEAIKSIIHYPVYFFSCYAEVKKRGFHVDDGQWISEAKTFVLKMELDPSKELNVLTVGCGNGLVDEPIIDSLLTKYSPITYMAVDPAVDELAKFKQLVKDNKDKWQKVSFEFHLTTIEDYLKTNEAKQFGVIVASHSAYHFKDAERTMVDLYNRLVKRGILFTKMIIGGWEKIFLKEGEFFSDTRFNFIGSQVIEDIFKRRIPNARYESRAREFRVDVTECFDEESQVGYYMIDFITNIYQFRDSCKPDIKKEITEYLRDECCEKEGDKYLFIAEERDLFLYKE